MFEFLTLLFTFGYLLIAEKVVSSLVAISHLFVVNRIYCDLRSLNHPVLANTERALLRVMQ